MSVEIEITTIEHGDLIAGKKQEPYFDSKQEQDYKVEIKINAKHGELTEEIQQTMKAKVANLPRLFNRTTGIQVIADLSNSISPKVEIIVSAEESHDFFASQSGVNVIEALDLTISKIEQQLRKHKEKITEHRGPSKNVHET